MTLDNSSLLLLAAPAALLFVSVAAIWRPRPPSVLFEGLAVGAAAFSIYMAAIGAALLINHGPMHSTTLGWPASGLSIQIEPLSMAAFAMISLAAFYFIRRPPGHIRGEPTSGAYLGRLSATIASLQLLVLTDQLATLIIALIFAAIALHQLLVFHRSRRGLMPASHAPQLGNPRGI
jgi:NAD(P)H-quinone oxidoreductase subunit 5